MANAAGRGSADVSGHLVMLVMVDGRLVAMESGNFSYYGRTVERGWILNTSSHLETLTLYCRPQRLQNSLGFGLGFIFSFQDTSTNDTSMARSKF